MVAPLAAAAVIGGTALEVFGGMEAADAEKKRARAEARGAREMHAATKEQNAVYREMADEQRKTAKLKAKQYEIYAEEFNTRSQEVTDEINQLVLDKTDAMNRASDAQFERNQAEIQQGVLNSIRDYRQNVRAGLAEASAALAAAQFRGMQGGSGAAAGVADAGTQVARGNMAIWQNLGILDQIDAANQLYALALTEANWFEAMATTAANEWQHEKNVMDVTLQSAQLQADVKGLDAQTKLQKKLYRIEDKKSGIQTRTNIATGNARSDMAEGQAIASIGSSLSSAGMNLFG